VRSQHNILQERGTITYFLSVRESVGNERSALDSGGMGYNHIRTTESNGQRLIL